MVGALKARRPWAAALVALVFSPFVGMLYLGRGWIAIIYLFAEFIAGVAIVLTTGPHSIFEITGVLVVWAVTIAFRLVGAIQAFVLARGDDSARYVRWYAHWYSLIAIVVGLYAGVISTRAFLYQPFDSASVSMSPTLNQGDAFLVSKWAYSAQEPQPGDIAVFYLRDQGGIEYVKRIVGLPGDRVQMIAGVLTINGNPVRMRRVEDWVGDCGDRNCTVRQLEEILPNGRAYRVLDSVQNSTLDNTDVFIVPPKNYFVLGDNRDNSDDSRTDVGFVSREAIAGKVEFKYWDGRQHRAVFVPVD